MRISPVFILVTALATTLVAFAAQQDPTRQEPRSNFAQESTSASAKQNDGILATWLLVDNNYEIALAELAGQRAQNPEVKQFAQKLIADHRQMGQKLQAFASATGSNTAGTLKGNDPLDGGSVSGTTDGKPTDGRPQEAGARKNPVTDSLDHVALLQELGEQCLATARKELEQKQGADFDRCFVGMAIGGHMKVNDAMTVFQRHASSQLEAVLAEGQKTVQMHLAQAKELGKKLEGTASGAPEKK